MNTVSNGVARAMIVAILAMTLGSVLGCGQEEQPTAPLRRVAAIQLQDATGLIEGELPGRAEADQEVERAFRVTGSLIELPVKRGDRVTRGQLLAKLDPRDFRNAVVEAEGRLQRANADVQVARNDYERALNIKAENPGAISQAVIDQRQGALRQAEATVVSTRARLEDAQNALKDTALTAPFDAVVVETYVNNFEEVKADQPVVRLVDPSKVKVTVQVPEQNIGNLGAIRSVVCRFEPQRNVVIEVPARIAEVGTEASRDTRTYPVTLIMDQPKDGKSVILPGMAAKVRATLDASSTRGAGQLTVPVSAVFADEKDQTFVWLVDEATRRVKRQSVTVGQPSPTGLNVDGLAPGMWVVTAGVHFLTDDQQVRLPEADGDGS